MTYTVIEYPAMAQKFVVWATAPNGNGKVVKAFKTRQGAENWIRKHS